MSDPWPGLCQRGEQPPRDPADETLRLCRMGDKLCIATVSSDSKQETTGHILVSLRNAWTLVGLLSFFIGLDLPTKIKKRIHL